MSRNGNGRSGNGRRRASARYPAHIRQKARDLYVVHGLPMDEIEEKLAPDGPPVGTLRNWSRKENWLASRHRHMEQVAEQQAGERRALIQRENERMLQVWHAALAQAQRILVPMVEETGADGVARKVPAPIDAAVLDAGTRSLARIQTGIRLTLGITDEPVLEQRVTITYQPITEIAEDVLKREAG